MTSGIHLIRINEEKSSLKLWVYSKLVCVRSHLENFDVREDHDCQGPVEAHRAGEHQVADVLSEGALPGWSGA